MHRRNIHYNSAIRNLWKMTKQNAVKALFVLYFVYHKLSPIQSRKEIMGGFRRRRRFCVFIGTDDWREVNTTYVGVS